MGIRPSWYCEQGAGDVALGPEPRISTVIDRPETVLEMARRHVLEGEERLARQIAIVAKLERNSHTDAALATKVLEAIRLSLDMSKRHLADLERRSKR
jgi:hypothetical protein